MELPRRARGDELLPPGALAVVCDRLRGLARHQDLVSVVACAFDHRTRMLPFIYADTRMAPAGARAIGSALVAAGFPKTRIVLQQWNPNFHPAEMRLDGRRPDLFLVSSMQIHTAACHALIRAAGRIDAAHRPLIIAGGPKTVYEPWDVFSADAHDPWGADVAVTGEEYVLLSLLERLLTLRGRDEPLRASFLRARDAGLLDDIPGLVYARTGPTGVPEELVDTGIQRLVGNLDELPHPAIGFRLLEPPSRRTTLQSRALAPEQVRRHSPIASLVLTFGCKFNCPYCPIPAYNQRQHRVKSGARVADEFARLHREYGLRYFFGADDNFFNHKQRTLDIVETLARTEIDGVPIRKKLRWGTEVTVHDTLQLRDHLPTVRTAGVRALWLGVEDMTATLVNKGQSVDKTTEAFRLLRRHGICPMPMMMHHDQQPLFTRRGEYGLLNQARLLRKAGAISLQVLMMTPATGSRFYEGAYRAGRVYASAGGRPVEPYMLDANYVVASEHRQPWRKQLNIMAVYLYFYNPLRFLLAVVRPKSKLYFADAFVQLIGMWGLSRTVRRTLGWAMRLLRGDIRRQVTAPASAVPMRAVDGRPADHALPLLAVESELRPEDAALQRTRPRLGDRAGPAVTSAVDAVVPPVLTLPLRVDPTT
ncbi:MAG: radical SAM protein [Phycisphaerae bacterium]|nr:radical SAM protein [Phycisphaerae bacterium]HQL54715.1 radical SAM protein [Phycisphaerae bacterium]